jgi:hypothetical protein
MTAYKLFRVRKDGTIGSLFINARRRLPIGEWMTAEPYPTSGFAFRPGWHALVKPEAPHLSKTGRAWFVVEVENFERHTRPASQGGEWLLAKRMKIVRKLIDKP